MSTAKRGKLSSCDPNVVKSHDKNRRSVQEDVNAAANKRIKTSINRDNCSSKIPVSRPLSTYRAPFGKFDGNTIYRNRIVVEEEFRKDGHYCIEELILPDCTAALCTTFHSSQLRWLDTIFGDIRQLTVVKASPNESEHVIGNAAVEKMSKDHDDWYWVLSRPHSGGCFHSKVILFRSKRGLRVVVSGSNLSKGQWTRHRDVFWVQDFSLLPSGSQQYTGTFGDQLHRVLKNMMGCKGKEKQALMTRRLMNIFDNINFDDARAQLVISFPRPKETKRKTHVEDYNSLKETVGGYKALCKAVKRAKTSRAMMGCDSSDDDDDDDEAPGQTGSPPRLFASSGSFGDIEPAFVLQMYQAMKGEDSDSKSLKHTEWSDCDALVKVLYPSIETAATIDLIGLSGCMRHIPQKHLDKIPAESRQRLLHDAIPNPPTKLPSPLDHTQTFHAATHGKFLYNSHGVLYVGSHNFSKNAWGLRDAMPKNVEIGVVLASINESRWAEWCSRLPCLLVAPNAKAAKGYVPYAGLKTIAKHHPMAETQKSLWRRFQAMEAAKALYKKAEKVLQESDRWLIETPLEDLTLEELMTMLRDYGPIIKEAIEGDDD